MTAKHTSDSAKVRVDLLEGLCDLSRVTDITLVGLALYAVLFGDFGSDIVSVLGRAEDDCDIGASLCECFCDS